MVSIPLFVGIFMYVMNIRFDLMVGWVDSAIYYSLFFDGQAVMERFDSVYFSIRWPWILLGQFVFWIMPQGWEMAGFSILVVSFIGLATFLFARNFLTTLSALLAALMVACNLQVIQTVVSGYPSAFSAALVLVGANFAIRGYKANNNSQLVYAGLFYGLALMAHQFSLVIGLPIHFGILLFYRNGLDLRSLMDRERWIVLGEIFVAVITVAVVVWRGLSFKVFDSILGVAKSAAFKGSGTNYSKDLEIVLSDGGPYLFLISALIVALIVILKPGGKLSSTEKNIGRLLGICFLLLLLPIVAWDVLLNASTLQYGFYQVFLFGGAAAQIALLLDASEEYLSIPKSAIVPIWFVTMLLLLFGLAGMPITEQVFVDESKIVFMLFFGAVAVLVLGMVVIKYRIFSTIALCLLLVSVSVASSFTRFGVAAATPGFNDTAGADVAKWALSKANKFAESDRPLLIAYDGRNVVGEGSINQNDRWPFFFRGNQQYFSIFDTIGGTSFFSKGLLTYEFQTFYVALARYLAKTGKTSLLYVWQGENQESVIAEKLAPENLGLVELESGEYSSERFRFNYKIFEITCEDC